MKSLMLKTALALAVASPLMASAESQVASGAADASARLNLQVDVPRVLFLAVGPGAGAAGTALTNNGTVEVVSLTDTLNPEDVGNGTPTQSVDVPVRVFGNNGTISLSTGLVADLTDPITLATISLSKVTPQSDNTDLPVPAFNGTSVTVTATNGLVTDRTANWRYIYANDVRPAAGIYSTTVNYTATMP